MANAQAREIDISQQACYAHQHDYVKRLFQQKNDKKTGHQRKGVTALLRCQIGVC
jgi:hypothetical protein